MVNYKLLNLIGEINEDMDNKVANFISTIIEEDNTSPIIITINSNGGNIVSGFSIFNRLKSIPNQISTVILGECCSVANIIYLVASFNNRFAFPFTSFCLRSVFCENDDNITKSETEARNYNEFIKTILKNRTSISEDTLDKIYTNNPSEIRYFYSKFENLKIGNIIHSFDNITL